MKISDFLATTAKDIWEVEYMTTSDEEDNDSEPEERLEDPQEGEQNSS